MLDDLNLTSCYVDNFAFKREAFCAAKNATSATRLLAWANMVHELYAECFFGLMSIAQLTIRPRLLLQPLQIADNPLGPGLAFFCSPPSEPSPGLAGFVSRHAPQRAPSLHDRVGHIGAGTFILTGLLCRHPQITGRKLRRHRRQLRTSSGAKRSRPAETDFPVYPPAEMRNEPEIC